MKKLFALLLAVVMMMSLVACGGGGGKVEKGSNKTASGESDKDVMVDIWTIWANDNKRIVWWEEQAKAFAAEYEEKTGISVEIGFFNQSGYNGVAEKLTAGAVSGVLPVMSMCEEQQMIQFKAIAEDQSKYVSKELIDDYIDGLMVSCTWDGVVRSFPCGRSYPGLYVNADILAETGYTLDDLSTWDGVRAACQKAKSLGYEGISMEWDSDLWIFESMLYSEGGEIASPDGKTITFAEKGDVYLKLVQEMLAEGSAIDLYGKVEDVGNAFAEMITSNKLLCRIASCTSYATMKYQAEEAGVSLNASEVMTFIPFPEGMTTGKRSHTTGGSNWFITTAGNETQKKVAGAFLEYLGDPTRIAQWNEVSGYVCITESGLASDYYKNLVGDDPNYQRVNDGLQYAHTRATTPQWREIYTALNDYMWDFSANSASYDVDTMLQEWTAIAQKIVDDAQ